MLRQLGVLGRSLDELGRSLSVLGLSLGVLGRSLGVLGRSLGVLGRSSSPRATPGVLPDHLCNSMCCAFVAGEQQEFASI